MSLTAKIEELKKRAPKPKWRASHGQWIGPAWLVRGLVEAGQPVTEAVRIVIREEGIEPRDIAERSIRQAYYQIRKRPWPEEVEIENMEV